MEYSTKSILYSPHLNTVYFYLTLSSLFPLGILVYRLYLSPIARFPGPTLAACTGWYEAYYQLIQGGGGRFTFHLQRLHDTYGKNRVAALRMLSSVINVLTKVVGPIIRISPWEIHIRDPGFYDTIYSTSHPLDKPKSVAHWSGIYNATFTTTGHALHRLRRSAIAPSFSKRKVLDRAPFIQSQVEKICSRLTQDYVGRDKTVIMNDLFTCYAADVILESMFAMSYGFLDSPKFECPFGKSMKGLKSMAHLSAQFPWIPWLANRLPEKLLLRLQPSLAAIIGMQDVRIALALCNTRKIAELSLGDRHPDQKRS